MFLTAVDEKETMVIGNTCKNKTSTDFNEMGMTIVKSFTDLLRISKPHTSAACQYKLVHFQTK